MIRHEADDRFFCGFPTDTSKGLFDNPPKNGEIPSWQVSTFKSPRPGEGPTPWVSQHHDDDMNHF